MALPVNPSASITSTRCQTSQHHRNITTVLTSTSDTAGVQTQVSAGVSEQMDSFLFRSLSLSCLLTVRLARTPTPTRFAIPNDRAQAGGQALLEMSAAADAPPRDLFPPLLRFNLFFAFSPHKRQTLRISWGIFSCRDCCHIPKVP